MHLNIVKIVSVVFLIFLSRTSRCRGKSIDLVERNQTANSTSEFNSTVHEQSITTAGQDPCKPNPCENGGSCRFDSDFPENFTCQCKAEYIGDRCEIDQCMFIQCANNQVCVLEDGDLKCKEKIITLPQVKGYKADCNPACENDANCERNEDGANVCNCPPEFTGPTCAIPVCYPPCENNGKCQKKEDGDHVCNCPPEFAGPTCGIPLCNPACENDANCEKDENGDHVCNCSSEFTGPTCAIHPCEPNPCKNGGSCIISSDYPGNFTCECREEYIGDNCEIDQCMFMQCKDDEFCVFKDGTPICDEVSISSELFLMTSSPMVGLPLQFYCRARGPPGTNITWMFENAQLITDERRQIVSNHTVFITKADISDSGTYKCIVQYLNSMITDSVTVEVKHPCEPNPCKNDGLCMFYSDFPENFACECKEGYIGKTCGLEHPCNNNPCLNGGQCILTEDKATCICKNSFKGDYCEIALKNKCPLYCEETGGFCALDENSEIKCRCPSGTKYVDYNGCQGACRKNICKNGGTCVLNGLQQQPACLCREPFAGYFCEKRIDLPQKQMNTIILSVVCVLLIVLCVGVFCLQCNRIRSMRK